MLCGGAPRSCQAAGGGAMAGARLAALDGLVRELLTEEVPSRIASLTEELFQAAESIPVEDVSGAEVEEAAVSLWNWTVTKHTASVVSDEQRAKLRVAACRLLCLCEGSQPSEETLRRLILMSMKTGKGWIDLGKADLADEFLEVAVSSIEKLCARFLGGSDGEADTGVHRADVEKNLFKVLSYQAESAVAQGHFQKAVKCLQCCKEMLIKLPKETCYLAILCYNFGVENYEWKRYEQSSFWLRELVGLEFLRSVPERFASSPDLGKITLLHLEFLLQNSRELLAKQKVEEIITGHYSGKQLLPEALNQLHVILWDRAAKHYEAKSYSAALQWYSYSASFYTPGQIDQNLAKLQRNMASCHLHLHQLGKAKEAVKEAERCDPDSIFTKFSVYKIAVMEKDTDKVTASFVHMYRLGTTQHNVNIKAAACLAEAKMWELRITSRCCVGGRLLSVVTNRKTVEAVIEMGKLVEKSSQHEDKLRVDESTGTNLLSLAAQIALENQQQVVAIRALEHLAEHLQDCQQLFAALKCLVRLVLSKLAAENEEKRKEEMKSMLTYLTLAHKRLAASFTDEKFTGDMRILEAHWFRKVAWNLAVQSKGCPEHMRDFFLLSFKLSQFCPSDKAVLMAQKTCLVMAAAIELDMGREQLTPSEQMELFTQALQHLQACKEIWKVLKLTGDFAKDPTDTLLLLYEFEARAKLNDPALHNLMEPLWDQPQAEAKTLEIIASLAMEPPAQYPELCKKALKAALNLHRKQSVIDAVKLSQCLHSLINLSLPAGLTDLDACVLQEVWDYFQDALSVVCSTDAYPEMEILWLMTRAWNTGIFQYTTGKYKEAEQWCGLGMRFLHHLGSLKKSYEGHMIGLYSEVLDKLDRAKRFQPDEDEQ
ncbi:testis-expressed protein 11 isoform X7 [Pogoniulus pusillus]|uniref:testis-expressed protein 11 isoform X7 n=1 Tax=Pogoniulus pusillus TaxID=488313 RepID=UPI0030B96F62